MSRSACLIFNPASGQGDWEADLEKIQTLLESEIELDIQLTTQELDADQLASEAVARGVESIIASGGDGTISAAVGALVGTDIPLGVISRGTANAFASALGIPPTIEAACETILAGGTRSVDTARCNDLPMVLLAGVGFEAETVEDANREEKQRWGTLAYILSGMRQLQELENFTAEIETDDKIVTVTAAAVTIANAAPPTSILAQGPAEILVDDGLLDVTIVAPSNPTGAIATAYHLLQSASQDKPAGRDDIGYLRAKRVKISAEPPQKVVLDGEMIGTTPVVVECIPSSLTVFVPLAQTEKPDEKLEGLPDLKVELKS